MKTRTLWVLAFVFMVVFALYAASTTVRSLAIVSSTVDSTAIGSITPSTGAFTTVTASSTLNVTGTSTLGRTQINTGVSNNGTGLQHVRTTTCSVAASANANCNTVVTWPTAFVDGNYSVSCFVGAGSSLFAISYGNKVGSSMNVLIGNDPGFTGGGTAIVDCIGMHD